MHFYEMFDFGSRLYPLTENFPKPLPEVAGKTVLDWLPDFSLTSFIRYALRKNAPCTLRCYEPSFRRLTKEFVSKEQSL